MPSDLLLAELKAPCELDNLADILTRVEQKVRTAPSGFWEAESMKTYDQTYIAVLLTRLKFLLLATRRQQMLISELRDSLKDEKLVV